MRRASLPRSVVLSCAALLIVGVVILIPSPAADAAPPLCGGKPATIVGTTGDDVLKGTDGDDVIVGLAGDDLIKGLGGNDTLCGQYGNDILVGGAGDDVLWAGPGSDWVSYGLAPNGVVVHLGTGVSTGWGTDQLRSIENILGSPWNDDLVGNGSRNVIKGGSGDDTIVGRRSSDHLYGGLGDDILRGKQGSDVLDGQDGYEVPPFLRTRSVWGLRVLPERRGYGWTVLAGVSAEGGGVGS